MTHDGGGRATTDGEDAQAEITAVLRGPRVIAATSGAVALGAAGLLVQHGTLVAGALVACVFATLVLLLCAAQIVGFSPAAVARLKRSAELGDARFAWRKVGSGGHTSVPFVDGVSRDRIGVLNDVAQGVPVEIGHLVTHMHPNPGLPTRKKGYAIVQLPERLPHMVLDFGHLSRFLGVRLMPAAWDRSQRVDVGGGHRFRLFVVDGGEQLVSAIFTPELVRVLREVGRQHDVEIKGRQLYLFSNRSMASGSDRRWHRQRALVDRLAAAIQDPGIWDLAKRQNSGRGPTRDALRTDVKRGVIIVLSVAAAVVAILSAVVLYARDQGLLNV